jgi:hypothetical protein
MITIEKSLIVGDEAAREKRNQYWQMLRRANADFLKQGFTDGIGDGVFVYYLKQKYGIEIELIDSKITSNYIIRDEKKYTIFLLKYG